MPSWRAPDSPRAARQEEKRDAKQAGGTWRAVKHVEASYLAMVGATDVKQRVGDKKIAEYAAAQ